MNNNIFEPLRLMPDNFWDWSMPTPFSQGWRCGCFVFVGGQISADNEGSAIGVGDIETQTRNVFRNIEKVLDEAGAELKDIVKLNTFYVYNGERDEIKKYWEKMTAVRLEFIKEPGPAATAVRVSGLAYPDLLIEVEAVAYIAER